MIDESQTAQLVGGGECFLHYHPQEPLNFDDHVDVMASDPVTEVNANYTPTSTDYTILVDTSAGDVTITMPIAANGREYQIVKVSAANRLFIVPAATETIIGSLTGVIVYNIFTSLHHKAVTGGWIFV